MTYPRVRSATTPERPAPGSRRRDHANVMRDGWRSAAPQPPFRHITWLRFTAPLPSAARMLDSAHCILHVDLRHDTDSRDSYGALPVKSWLRRLVAGWQYSAWRREQRLVPKNPALHVSQVPPGFKALLAQCIPGGLVDS